MSEPLRRSSCRLAFLSVLLLVAVVRGRLLDIPLERDEGEYAYAGQLLLEGVPPYAEVYNMKLPGAYLAYALIELLFGQTVAGIHFGFLIVNAATSLLVFLVGRKLFACEAAGVMSGASYALLSLGPGVLGTSAHATHFVLPPVLGGLLLLLRAREAERTWPGFLCLALFGTAVVMKQQAIFFPIFAALWVAPGIVRQPKPIRWLVALLCALIAPLAVTCLWLWQAGVWRTFWFWTFRYAQEYVTITPIAAGWANLASQLPGVIGPSWPVWLLAAVGLLGLSLGRPRSANRTLLLAFSVASCLTLVPGLFFRPHYFVTMLPAVALLAAFGCSMIPWPAAARVVVGAAALASLVIGPREFLFRLDPVQASRHLYDVEPFAEAEELGRLLGSRTTPAERIAVLGAEPQIFFHARRRSATGYIYFYGVWENQRFSERMAREMIEEIESARPRYVVVEFVPAIMRPWATRFLQTSYELEGRVGTLQFWRMR